MTHDYHDPDDSTDLRDWFTRRLRHWQKLGDVQERGEVPYDGPAPSGRSPAGKRIAQVLASALLMILAAVAIKFGVLDGPGGESRQPRPPRTHALYAQRAVRVHAEPSGSSNVVRTLAPGERVLASQGDDREWVRVFEPGGGTVGYAYESNGNLSAEPPSRTPIDPPSPRPGGPRPRVQASPTDTTAICRDGWVSSSKHASGTCSGHGGVAQWINHP